MPGPLLNAASVVLCTHGAPAQATATNPRVLVAGMPVATVAAPHAVAGCAYNVSGAPSPCVTAAWVTNAARVFAGGVPVVLMDSQAICAPNGTPAIVCATQPRVLGT